MLSVILLYCVDLKLLWPQAAGFNVNAFIMNHVWKLINWTIICWVAFCVLLHWSTLECECLLRETLFEYCWLDCIWMSTHLKVSQIQHQTSPMTHIRSSHSSATINVTWYLVPQALSQECWDPTFYLILKQCCDFELHLKGLWPAWGYPLLSFP